MSLSYFVRRPSDNKSVSLRTMGYSDGQGLITVLESCVPHGTTVKGTIPPNPSTVLPLESPKTRSQKVFEMLSSEPATCWAAILERVSLRRNKV